MTPERIAAFLSGVLLALAAIAWRKGRRLDAILVAAQALAAFAWSLGA